MTRLTRLVLLAVVALIGAGTLAQLLHDSERQSGSALRGPLKFLEFRDGEQCEPGQTSYADTAAYRMTIGTYGRPSPELELRVVSADGDVVARGGLPAGFSEGVVDIPLDRPTTRDTRDVEVCLTWDDRPKLALAGTDDGLSLIQLRPGKTSLLSDAGDIAERYGRGNASWLGTWTMVVIVLLTLGGLGLGLTSLFRPQPWRPVGAFLLIGTAWALLSPPFQVPDETAHYAYVARIVETADLPENGTGDDFSPAQYDTLDGLNFYRLIGSPLRKPPWTASEERRLRELDGRDVSRTPQLAGTASANPPLYYLLQAPVYAATRWTSVLGQQLPMRLLSVLLGGATVLFCLLFLRELLPRSPWAWSVGALAVAFQPMFGFITSGVNADALMLAAGAATFWLMAVAVQRGLTRNVALGLGAALAAGALTKPLFLALIPAALLAVAVATWRSRDLRPALLTLVVTFAPVVAYAVIGKLGFDHGYFQEGTTVSGLSGDAAGGAKDPSRRELISYVWQLWLPRLPFMDDTFPEGMPLRLVWFDGFIGRFGWLDYSFASWVTGIAKWIALALLAAAVVAIARTRRWALLVCLAAGAAGLAAVIGIQQYNVFITGAEGAYTQPRYLLPLLALYAGLVAVAVKALGNRWGPIAGVVLIGLAALHEISAMVLTVSRYYA